MTHVVNDPVPLQKRPEGLINVSKDTRVDDDSPLPIHALVVDDDQLTRRLMVRMLQRIGCNVETAENGQRALEIILGGGSGPSDNFEIVFLDNQMPVLSGVQMVKRLRELGRTEFIVGITGNALKEDQAEYMEAGLDKVLTKPVLERSLKEMLKLVLDRRRTPE
ncbi:hypothetical protein BS47DRAFT_1303663 [Hydnum rufescens UP504]|uniref:Response regulatory domain-containing protein n=1 Tax=Hydnum rufescens UP504 TaxID=1448309 RepID=A0A9P6ALS9_9AGAM|nr:hypothetical protein BS47DRAFT_1303663 [Hydnum rufescens UP504]